MKNKIFILSFVSLALTVVGATASMQNNSEVTQLPTYRYETARYTPVERAIEDSLAELRATASVQATRNLLPEVAPKHANDKADVATEMAKKPVPATRVAKS